MRHIHDVFYRTEPITRERRRAADAEPLEKKVGEVAGARARRLYLDTCPIDFTAAHINRQSASSIR